LVTASLTTAAHRRMKVTSPNGVGSRDERYLKYFVLSLFLPEGLSLFVGDFRLSPQRLALIVLLIVAALRGGARKRHLALVPSDIFSVAAGTWMILAAIMTDGLTAAFKGGAASALEFTGTYYVFRYFLGDSDSAVRVIRFSCKVVVGVICIGLIDWLTGTLFTYEAVKSITGYSKESIDVGLIIGAESVYRNGHIRAMGPLEHSILFGAVCGWFGALAFSVFSSRLFSGCVAMFAMLGVLASQARGPLAAYVILLGLVYFASLTKHFRVRWKILGGLVGVYLFTVFLFSGSPVATLLRFGGISPEAGWYRELIWTTAVPQLMKSPFFGLGLVPAWDWQGTDLAGWSVDAFWLESAMQYGIPGSVLIFLTMSGAFWRGSVDRSPYLSDRERVLSVTLGLLVTVIIFLGFTVHFWGICGILIAAFPAIRANLAEAAAIRGGGYSVRASRPSIQFRAGHATSGVRTAGKSIREAGDVQIGDH
jgi:hypothetical protein